MQKREVRRHGKAAVAVTMTSVLPEYGGPGPLRPRARYDVTIADTTDRPPANASGAPLRGTGHGLKVNVTREGTKEALLVSHGKALMSPAGGCGRRGWEAGWGCPATHDDLSAAESTSCPQTVRRFSNELWSG